MHIDLKSTVIGAGIVALLLGGTALKSKEDTYVAVTSRSLNSLIRDLNERAEEGYRLNTFATDSDGRFVAIISR